MNKLLPFTISVLAAMWNVSGGLAHAQISQLARDSQLDGLKRPGASRLEHAVLALFAELPEQKALKIWAPASASGQEILIHLHGRERLFSASANKSFVLCERLRQLDSPMVAEALRNHDLALDRGVWAIGSTVFNPPDLAGLVSERTVLEAMITHSDNTATDMALRTAGADRVRQFISSIGLQSTQIPDSTRALAGYVFGAPDYLNLTWEELLALRDRPLVHPFLNDVETFSSSASDLVQFYAQALQGDFFRNRQTLEEFRRILSLGDINYLVGFPLGISVFGKAGYFDTAEQHARCIAGGMYLTHRWVYFAFLLNWTDPDETVAARFYDAIRKAVELLRDESCA